MIESTSVLLDSLPEKACPQDESVAVITLHPQYISKTAFPDAALRSAGLELIGSRATKIKPERWNKIKSKEGKETKVCPSTNIFVAGKRTLFHQWTALLKNEETSLPGDVQLHTIEVIKAFDPNESLRLLPSDIEEEPVLEVVLHASQEREWVIEGFEEYLQELGLTLNLDHMLNFGGLCFVPLRAHRDLLPQISQFSFLRVVRIMPRLRPLQPVVRSTFTCHRATLPTEGPVDPNLRVAIFDGGLPSAHPYEPWVEHFDDFEDIGAPVDEYLEHGSTVTSALLFGSLEPNSVADRPYAAVDHYRVLDDNSNRDPEELYDVLNRILSVLQRGEHQFFALSIGPALPVEDDDVHSWTAALDDHLKDGTVLAAMAVGNTGDNDWQSGNARVQVPSDCVNGLAVGACDRLGPLWARASYSSIGPGRSPGAVKPDVLCFGGSIEDPFHVLDPSSASRTVGVMGTSYATPAALRIGLGIRAQFGNRLSPMAIKALLIHASETRDDGDSLREVGWGRLPMNLDDYVACSDGMARILYQGEIAPAKWVRTVIPLPEAALEGNVTLSATFTFATQTDPQTPGDYTRSGLEVVFRPHSEKVDINGLAQTRPFFRKKEFETETELRKFAHKWETAMHEKHGMRGSSLKNPVFDIHYIAREGGAKASSADKIRYALVVTVISRRTADLYTRLMQRYRTLLRPIMPVNVIPVRTQLR
jgi:hypothetical protein